MRGSITCSRSRAPSACAFNGKPKVTRPRRPLNRIHAVETNPHPDPLPYTKGEGNLRWHRVRVTQQGSETGAFQLSSPRSERGEDQGEGRFRLHTYGLTALVCRDVKLAQAVCCFLRPRLK